MESKKVLVSIIILALSVLSVPAMALDPGPFDISIQGNEDYLLYLTFYADAAKTTPLNLTGHRFISAAKGSVNDTTAFFNFSTSTPTPANGQLIMRLRRNITRANVNKAGVYDIKDIAPDGSWSYPVKGTIKIMSTVTP